jgi:prepilin-type N-terminal cleavage/methylation domain-containing protein
MGFRQRESGFTLVESLTALVVLSVAVGAILTPVIAAVEQKQRTAKQVLAATLAEQLIEECLGQETFSIQDPIELGPSGGETWRNYYDEMADYHGVTEGPGAFGTVYGPPLAYSQFPRLRRTMHIGTYYLPGQYTEYSPDLILLTVRVYDGDEELVTVQRLIANEKHDLP